MVIVTIEAFTGSFTEIKYTTMTTTGLNGDSDEIASHAGNCSAWRQRVRTATRESWPTVPYYWYDYYRWKNPAFEIHRVKRLEGAFQS